MLSLLVNPAAAGVAVEGLYRASVAAGEEGNGAPTPNTPLGAATPNGVFTKDEAVLPDGAELLILVALVAAVN